MEVVLGGSEVRTTDLKMTRTYLCPGPSPRSTPVGSRPAPDRSTSSTPPRTELSRTVPGLPAPVPHPHRSLLTRTGSHHSSRSPAPVQTRPDPATPRLGPFHSTPLVLPAPGPLRSSPNSPVSGSTTTPPPHPPPPTSTSSLGTRTHREHPGVKERGRDISFLERRGCVAFSRRGVDKGPHSIGSMGPHLEVHLDTGWAIVLKLQPFQTVFNEGRVRLRGALPPPGVLGADRGR